MQIIDLFSGIGGFSLAGRWMGWNTVSFCEKDKYCTKILKQHWPNVPVFDDVKTLTYEKIKQETTWNESEPTILVGGFPCQPFSNSGRQKAEADDRHLWPQMLRLIRETRPKWVVAENVNGIIKLALDQVLSSLEAENYTVEAFIIPACAVNAPHRRDRVWIIAHANGIGLQEKPQGFREVLSIPNARPPSKFGRHSKLTKEITKRGSGDIRAGNGISNWMDRIKALGNAVVPQVVYEIFKAIQIIEKS